MLVLKIAFRNILLHKLKTTITGLVIVFGTLLAILGNSVVDAISDGMEKSLTHSITGHLQIFSSEAKEALSVFGTIDGNMPDIGHVNDFRHVKSTLLARIPNIAAIIPTGGNFAMLNPGNLLDVKLEELRSALHEGGVKSARYQALKDHVRSIVRDVSDQYQANAADLAGLVTNSSIQRDAPGKIARATDPGFWETFDSRAEERIEFLANSMAPLIFDDTMIYLNYVGTLPQAFRDSFPLFEIVKGQEIPEGKRGFLFSDTVYETMVKNRVARRLDFIKKRMEKHHESLKVTKSLQDQVGANVAQAAEIYSQLDPASARLLVPKLQKELGSTKADGTDIRELLKKFLAMDDSNFSGRYRFFYDQIAPHIILYRVKIGDIFPITAFGKTGYSTSVNMKVYGTYRFKSFEDSPIAGSFNLMDMMSFRELFGFMTTERREENRQLEKEMGIKDVGREDMEALFSSGGGSAVEEAGRPARLDSAVKGLGGGPGGTHAKKQKAFELTYGPEEMENGIFLNAAVVLKDPKLLARTLKDVARVSKEEKLGIQAADWRQAAGIVGQLTLLVRGVLYFFVAVIFAVATFIMMNSMLMATQERSREIGTLRAIGAQKKLILELFFQETFILSFVFGAIGTILAISIILAINTVGIPAVNEVATFFFSGDRLFLSINPIHILVVFVCMTLVAVLSTQYPAWRAMKISPLEAMQKPE